MSCTDDLRMIPTKTLGTYAAAIVMHIRRYASLVRATENSSQGGALFNYGVINNSDDL